MPGCLASGQVLLMGAPFSITLDTQGYLRATFHEAAAGFLNRGPIQVSKVSAECDEIIVGQILSTEQENQVFKPSLINAGEIIIIDRSQVDALLNLGCQRLSRRNGGNPRTPA